MFLGRASALSESLRHEYLLEINPGGFHEFRFFPSLQVHDDAAVSPVAELALFFSEEVSGQDGHVHRCVAPFLFSAMTFSRDLWDGCAAKVWDPCTIRCLEASGFGRGLLDLSTWKYFGYVHDVHAAS